MADVRPEEASRLAGRVTAATGGSGSAVLVTGEVGIGKSTLLDLAIEHAVGQRMRVLRTEGLRAEADLPFGALQRLLPADLLTDAPPALAVALDSSSERTQPGDRFGPGAALHSVLAESASHGPVLVVVDDYQWLDHPSARAIGFVARRVGPLPMAIVLARRDGDGEPAPEGVAQLRLGRLTQGQVTTMLDGLGIVDSDARTAIVAGADGNPLTLASLARRASKPGEPPAGTFPVATGPGSMSPAAVFAADVAALSDSTRTALAAAGAVGAVAGRELDAVLERLDLSRADLEPAVLAQLLERRVPAALAFRHPLIRQEAWDQVGPATRRRIHLAISDAAVDPDRAAWHLAFAHDEPHEPAARALEGAARRATARGAPSLAHRALAASADLSPDPEQASRRSIAAAEAALRAGLRDRALALIAELHPASPQDRARVARVRIRAERVPDAPLQELTAAAAEGAASTDPALAAELYCDLAVRAVGELDGARASALAARACDLTGSLPGPHADRASVLLGLGRLLSGKSEAGAVLLRRWEGALENAGELGPLLDVVATALRWQSAFDEGRALTRAAAERARADGRIEELAIALSHLASIQVLQCELDDADLNAAEAISLAEVTGQGDVLAASLLARGAVAVVRGHEEQAESFLSRLDGPVTASPGLARMNTAAWRAELALDDGRPADALDLIAPFRSRGVASAAIWLGDTVEALVELGRQAEAAELVAGVSRGLVRSGHRRSAAMAARCAGLVAETRAEVDETFAEAARLVEEPPQPHPWIKAHLGWSRRLLELGHPVEALDHAARALAEARRVGASGLARRCEAARDQALTAGAPDGTDASTDAESSPLDRPSRPGVRLHLLGTFTVIVDGAETTLSGRPAAALQILAVHRLGIHADELAEMLWPDAPPGAGRQRQRNVLSRIRSAGIEIERHDGDVLRLPAHVVVDAHRFEDDARAALAATDPETKADLLRAAIAAYHHPLLPNARYESWAAAPRERLRMLALDVIETSVNSRSGVEQSRAVVELCLLAEEIEPLDEQWPIRVAEAELEAGHKAAATRAVERARAVLTDLCVPASPELKALEARIAAG